MAKNKKSKFSFKKQSVFIKLLASLFVVIFLLIIIVLKFRLNWTTFSSKKVTLSFKHPQSWPVSVCNDFIIFDVLGYSEQINFQEECDLNPESKKLGSIVVKNLDTSKEDYQGFLTEELNSFPDNSDQDIIIEKVRVGNTSGYKIKNHPVYYVFKNSYRYEIQLYESMLDNNKQIDLFEKILKTFKF